MDNLVDRYKFKKDSDIYMDIEYDEYAESPRDMYDHICSMLFIHKRYTLGDRHDWFSFGDRHDWFNSSNFSSWDEIEEYLRKEYEAVFVKPVYMLDHSVITISMKDFNDSWDSGRIGFIYITKTSMAQNNISSDKVIGIMESEVKEYDDYLTGQVFCYRQYKTIRCKCCGNTSVKDIDSCCGFYGNYIEAMEAYVDWSNWELIK